MKAEVSVIIPAYNHERFVGAAVESVLGQSYDRLQLIVIDDGSTDRTGEVVQGYDDPRLTYVHQENQDAYNALNRGLEMADGDFIAILNSDDVYFPERLEKLVGVQQETGAQCLFTDVVPIDDAGGELLDPDFGWNQWHRRNRAFYLAAGDLYTAFLKGNFMVTTSNLFLTGEAVRKVGRFCSLRYLHDYDYIFRVMLACPGKVRYLHEEQLLYYRIHDGNTLSEAAILGREQDRRVIGKYLLAALPEDLRPLVSAGSERLVELERELNEVRATLGQAPAEPGIRRQVQGLLRSLGRKLSARPCRSSSRQPGELRDKNK
ncbi:MAG: glycosyltransferase [Proteobacteria bacterium]|nr:glycosyltransferase [Pseudomonadota bacterium]